MRSSPTAARLLRGLLRPLQGRAIGALLAVGAALFAGLATYTYRDASEFIEGSRGAARANALRRGLEEVRADVAGLSRALDGFLARVDAPSAGRVMEESARIGRDTAALLSPDGGGPALGPALRELAEAAAMLHREVVRTAADCRGEACEQTAELLAGGGLRRELDRVDALARAALKRAEQQVLREEAAVEARERGARRSLLAVAGLGLALLTAALGFVIGQALLRGRAARALAENERRLQLVVDAMHDGLTFSDERGRFTIWNPAMEALTGYTLGDANAVDDLMARLYPDPEERARALEGLERLKEAESGRIVLREAVLTAKTGERRELLVSSSIVRRGDQLGFLSTYHDVTSPRQAEREREKLIHQLQSALADVKTLRGLLPICGWCKKVRDDQGYYHRIEAYISAHSEARFTHGICPECIRQFEGELARGDG